jgi:preprotein translocase subunit SecE
VSNKNDQTKVTRITASEKSTAPQKTRKSAVATTSKMPKKQRSYGLFGKIGGYFKGAWTELRQVHWPTRRATWGLTVAVLAFSAFFVAFITLLDVGFKFIFEQILK